MNGIARINPGPGKLWRFLQFPITRIVIAILALMIVITVIQIGAKALHLSPHSPSGVLVALILIVAVITTYQCYVRLIERRLVGEYAFAGAVAEFSRGFLIGMSLFACTILVLWLCGAANISTGGGWRALGYPLLGALLAGVIEETLIRGVLFRIIEESLGSWIALALSAAVFGALHAFNPGATAVSSVAIALEAGILLAAVFMYTRRLWMAIGLHAAWNFTEGGIFGASVSGTDAHGLLTSTFSGSTWLTGGKFGPEASIVAIIVCLTAGVIFLWLAGKRHFIAPPVWRRSKTGA
ncbi:MAG TPA: type II CAAX endopeptidase family protein [Gammaproteobacteria bacterium]|jgi:membrane protease YdiL (CAAX protease family)|nr:type II CAAX endopeptidase family protein [Gammaproteobacteria bacterium]